MEEEKTIRLEELIESLNEPIEIKGETLGILNLGAFILMIIYL